MAGQHGGARNRSGPTSSAFSARTDLKKSKGLLGAIKLPAEGYQGDFPVFPLTEGMQREGEVWAESWRTPQAAQWAKEPWRLRTIAMWVRYSVRMEDPESPAAIGATTTRLADQIGLTPAGLRENGWEIVAIVDEPDQKQTKATPAVPESAAPVRRLRSVDNGDG